MLTSFKITRPDRLDWLILVLIWTLGGYFIVTSGATNLGWDQSFYRYLSIVLINTPVILINVFILIPTFFNFRWILLYFLAFILIVAAFFPLEIMINNWLFSNWCNDCSYLPKLFDYVLSTAQEDAIFSSFFIAKQYLQFKSRADKAEKEKVKAELDFLKAQINPHFYFNTLNNLYGLALLKSDKAPDAILKLSEIMEYVIYDARSERVALEREIEYLKNYIELERLRLEHQANVAVKMKGSFDSFKIAPLLLLPLVENAFKHGTTDAENVDIRISITIQEESRKLMLLVKNRFEQNNITKGIGIDNLEKRLKLIYPNRYQLEQSIHDDFYISKLSLQL